VLGISSTFLAPQLKNGQYAQRSEGVESFYKGELWHENPDDLVLWLKKVKQIIRKKSPQVKLVIGGVKSQFAMWRPQFYPEIDYIFLGASDKSFANFVEGLKSGVEPSFIEKNGVKIVSTEEDINFKSCPVALWTAEDAIQKGEALPLEVARGCVFNCKFCHYDKKMSYKKELTTLKDELLRNYEFFGVNTYSLCDDCFNDHPDKVRNTCEVFLSLPFKIEWVAYSRVDVAVKFPETVEMMVESGAKGLYWGIESFNYDVARKAGKGTHPDKVKEFLNSFSAKFKDQCLTEISLITGLPGETEQSLEETERWLMDHADVDMVSVGALGLSPFVQDFDKKNIDYADYSRNPEKYGFIKVEFNPNYWEHETMNLPTAQQWAKRIRSNYLSKKPPGIGKSIWTYPHLKTLGFNQKEIFDMIRNPNVGSYDDVYKRFELFLKNYQNDLKQRVQCSN
jgi:radical SAM superfamily enzyme YgiQ (UPF0313 family)